MGMGKCGGRSWMYGHTRLGPRPRPSPRVTGTGMGTGRDSFRVLLGPFSKALHASYAPTPNRPSSSRANSVMHLRMAVKLHLAITFLRSDEGYRKGHRRSEGS